MIPATKINQLLQDLPYGSVLLSGWLNERGYTFSLQQSYRRSGWLVSIGKGAMVRTGQRLLLTGGIRALQQQAGSDIHIGGRTALGLLGYAHYLELSRKQTLVFVNNGTHIPAWFESNIWDSSPVVIRTSFLPQGIGLQNLDLNGIQVRISNTVRAFMECLHLAPERFDLTEAWEIMQALNALQPEIVKQMLTHCKSMKVRRLFLFFAEKAGHTWYNRLDAAEFDLGKGKRSLVRNGVYNAKYQITIPEILA
jgi:hypothetical protein